MFLVQVVTGIVLAMYYAPSPDHAYDSIRYLERAVVSGAMLRGIHHWGASAMVVLVLAHMIRVFSMGAYKYPREINWLLGVALLFIVLGFSFTGYLLPWDQKAYWATQVGTNIAGTTPLLGPTILKLLRGGAQLGAATLTRFFALHVLLLPMLLVTIVLLHLALVIRQGIAPRTAVLERDAPRRTTDPEYGDYYHSRYAQSKGAGVPFWPNIIYKDVLVGVRRGGDSRACSRACRARGWKRRPIQATRRTCRGPSGIFCRSSNSSSSFPARGRAPSPSDCRRRSWSCCCCFRSSIAGAFAR